MKKINKLIKLTLVITLILTMITPYLVYADTPSAGYNQVIKVGGTNDTNEIEDGVTISKEISELKSDGISSLENYFDITLKVKTRTKVKEQDLAIVLVMDISNTMLIKQTNQATRLQAAMTAAEQLIKDFAVYSQETSAIRKIGYVAFNTHANEIFDLTECKTTNKANELITTMNNKSNAIIGDPDVYKNSYDRFTNIEGGLKMAHDMLYSDANKNIENKYIVVLSDGFPTTYLKSGYTGYKTYSSATSSGEGNFYDAVRKLPCTYGTDYSDEAASRAQIMATKIKNKGTKIYAVGTGIDSNLLTVDQHVAKHLNNPFSTVQRETENYIIGKNTESFQRWLGGTGNASNPGIASGFDQGYYFNTTDTESLTNSYKKIFEDIKSASTSSWVIEDPMNHESTNKIIEIVGLYNDNQTKLYDNLVKNTATNENDKIRNTATFSNDKITWDLKQSNYKTTSDKDGATHFHYELKYRVRLKNELIQTSGGFIALKEYPSNGPTTFTYVVSGTNIAPKIKKINFPIPSVLGYLGNLSFNKVSNFDSEPLRDATFKLEHSENCICHTERKYPVIPEMYASSQDGTGLVSFTNIPSGHTYLLTETKAPDNHIKDNNTYEVNVLFGKTTVKLNGNLIDNFNIIENKIQTSNLKITKTVKSSVTISDKFKFKLEAKYNGIGINKTLKYTMNNNPIQKDITFVNGIAYVNNKDYLELKDKDIITIIDLPINLEYKVTEIKSNGYTTEYCINEATSCLSSNNILIGNIASGTINPNDNKVEFVNITSYVLPETGSAKALILVITGSLLMIIPVIYIIKLFYKKRIISKSKI